MVMSFIFCVLLIGIFLHILADTLGSVGVIISSALIHQFGMRGKRERGRERERERGRGRGRRRGRGGERESKIIYRSYPCSTIVCACVSRLDDC